jgi:hypothetical protein
MTENYRQNILLQPLCSKLYEEEPRLNFDTGCQHSWHDLLKIGMHTHILTIPDTVTGMQDTVMQLHARHRSIARLPGFCSTARCFSIVNKK